MSPISFADLMAETATVAVPTSLGPVEVQYRPNALTPAKEAEIQRLAKAADEDEEADYTLAVIFCSVVTSVDIAGPMVDDDGNELVPAGKLIPVEPDYIVHLSSRFIGRTFDAMREQLQQEDEEHSKPSRRAARASKNGSRRGSFTRQK